MQRTHPSDEPDQGTKGTEGPDTQSGQLGIQFQNVPQFYSRKTLVDKCGGFKDNELRFYS